MTTLLDKILEKSCYEINPNIDRGFGHICDISFGNLFENKRIRQSLWKNLRQLNSSFILIVS